jgi:V/A-type H+-transporting ATPase subunit I
MFYPELMSQVEIFVPEAHVLAATQAVARTGNCHLLDASYLNTAKEGGSEWRRRASTLTAMERRILTLMRTLDVEEGAPPADLSTQVELETVQTAADRLEQEVKHVVDELTEKQKQLDQLHSYIQQLEPVARINIDIDILRNPRYVYSILGIIPLEHIDRLRTSLMRIPHVLFPLYQDNQQAIVMLSGMEQHADVLERAARSAYLNPLNLPADYHGTPQEVIATLQTESQKLHEEITQDKAELAEMHDRRAEQLQNLLWQVRSGRVIADALARYGQLEYTYIILSWVPNSDLPELQQKLKQLSDEILIDVQPSERRHADPNVPVTLKNPGILGAFQQLVTTYGRPRYTEVDPTVFLTITFPLLFGAMFGDVGHGLVLALLGGLIASRKIPKLKSMADFGVIIAVCGILSIVFGFLYGSIFGLEDVIPALWFRPMDNIMKILIIAIGLGIVLLVVGFITGIVNAWTSGNWSEFWFGHSGVVGLVLYLSLLGLAGSIALPNFPVPTLVFIVSAAVSGLGVLFSDLLSRLVEGKRPLIEGGLPTYIIQIVFEAFETAVSLLSNSLSYVRVGAFAVAHGGLSAVIFILANMASASHGPLYWLVVAGGNLFIIGFEGMIVGIQTLRLEYYEFFSKFFTGGGAPYMPLTAVVESNES